MSIATVTPLHPAARPAAHPAVRAAARREAAGPRPALRLVAAPQPAPVAPLRLTRRGRALLRLLVLLAAVAIVGAGVLALQGSAAAGQDAGRAPVVTYHVVLPGETLWSIARQVAPGEDARGTVARIVELNALPGAQVYVGQRIALESHS